MQTQFDSRALEHRVRSEFLEMPGLCLTAAQASRLWALDPSTSEQILKELVAAGFLACTRRGRYLLASLA